MGSVDGRLLPGRWTPPYGSAGIAGVMAVYPALGRRLATDAWMFGKNTLCEGFFPEKFVAGEAAPEADPVCFKARRASERLFIVADPDADILYTASAVRGDDIAVILPTTAPADYLAHLRAMNISYLFAGERGDDLRSAMQTLCDEFGVRVISLQGGGIIDGAFLHAGLISELSLVVYPGIDGLASSPSIFEYTGPDSCAAPRQRLELLSVEEVGHGVVWLRYRVHVE